MSLLLVRLLAWLPAYRVLMVWVYDHTESLLLAILMHASLVAGQFIFFPAALAGAIALISLIIWAIVLWIVVAAVAMTNPGADRTLTVAKGVIEKRELPKLPI